MTELATFKSITELTEEMFYRMVGDYFSAGNRIEEIDKLIKELKESEKNLPKLDAFETYAEYLAAAHAHQAWDDVTGPPLKELRAERETVEKRKEVLSERLKELLPDGVWLRYGDRGIRVKSYGASAWLEKTYGPRWYKQRHPTLSQPIIELEVESWEKIRPIPKTITRTKKKGGLERVFFNACSGIGAPGKALGWAVATSVLVVIGVSLSLWWLLPISAATLFVFAYCVFMPPVVD